MEINLEQYDLSLPDLISKLNKHSEKALAVHSSLVSEQVHLSIKKETPEQIEANIAELLNYRWAENHGVQELFQPAASAIFERQVNQISLDKKLDEFGEICKALELPKEELERRASIPISKNVEYPYHFQRQFYGSLVYPQNRLLVAFFVSLPFNVIKEMFEGQGSYQIKWNTLSPDQQELVLQLTQLADGGSRTSCEEWLRQLQIIGVKATSAGYGSDSVSNLFISLGKHGVGIRTLKYPWTLNSSIFVHFNPYLARNLSQRIDQIVELKDPVLDKMNFPSSEYKESYPSIWLDSFSQLSKMLPYSLYSDAIPNHFAGESDELYVDSPETPNNPESIKSKRRSVTQALNHFCRIHRKIWWRKGDAIFFQSRRWSNAREERFPLEVYRELQDTVRTKGFLGVPDMLKLSKLTRKQLRGMREFARERSCRLTGNRDVLALDDASQYDYFYLQFFAKLSEKQKVQSLSPIGVLREEMTLIQKDAFFETLVQTGWGVQNVIGLKKFSIRQEVFKGKRKEDVNLLLIKYFPENGKNSFSFRECTGIVYSSLKKDIHS